MSKLTPVKSLSDLSEASDDTNVTELTSSSDDNSSEARRVSFGAIHIREHERIVGDHPETKVGVPLSLGWGYHDKKSIAIEQYEDERVLKGNHRMSSITRKRILHTVFGIPEEEIRAAEKEVRIISERNEKSQKKSEKKTKRSSAMKKVGKQVKKILNADAFIKGLAAASPGTAMMSY
eukprot:CAMPEP_0113627954 /NCGR_PEP_ID=MMETSP0017_2-20120614/14480_1 /TAXON_ID=2856 /ORGANISM="Cylindrotheca closterium" /LENGTH=177 /DNA_ID=CAMNT_0000538233 /DNA_START=408 /DNA_END=941 /DNA_ORIENTATION=+ /assembly_acc=CAM_ASM_000147